MEIITLAAGLAGFLGPLVVGAELTIEKIGSSPPVGETPIAGHGPSRRCDRPDGTIRGALG